jgi:hypothetical protein
MNENTKKFLSATATPLASIFGSEFLVIACAISVCLYIRILAAGSVGRAKTRGNWFCRSAGMKAVRAAGIL